MFRKADPHQAINAIGQHLIRLSESVDERFTKSHDLLSDITKAQKEERNAMIEVIGSRVFDVASDAGQKFESIMSILDDMSARKQELLGEMIKEAERRDAEFTRIDDAIAAIEKRLERLEAALEQPHDTNWSASVMHTKGLEIAYKAFDGTATRRTIIPESVGGEIMDGKRKIRDIEAVCTLRKAPRTFKPDRIQEAFDAETGEKVDVEAWLLTRLKG